MRSHVTFLSAAVAVVFLTGCSSQQLQMANSALPPSSVRRAPQPGLTPVPTQPGGNVEWSNYGF